MDGRESRREQEKEKIDVRNFRQMGKGRSWDRNNSEKVK